MAFGSIQGKLTGCFFSPKWEWKMIVSSSLGTSLTQQWPVSTVSNTASSEKDFIQSQTLWIPKWSHLLSSPKEGQLTIGAQRTPQLFSMHGSYPQSHLKPPCRSWSSTGRVAAPDKSLLCPSSSQVKPLYWDTTWGAAACPPQGWQSPGLSSKFSTIVLCSPQECYNFIHNSVPVLDIRNISRGAFGFKVSSEY